MYSVVLAGGAALVPVCPLKSVLLEAACLQRSQAVASEQQEHY
jgi:hypothetical protein